MSMTDPIADFLTRIRNAQMRRLKTVKIPFSRLKKSLAQLLLEEGFIAGVEEITEKNHQVLSIALKYYKGEPVIERLERVSRPGLRIYRGADKLPTIKNGLGEAIVSTSRGVMTARKAMAAGIGGELLCVVS